MNNKDYIFVAGFTLAEIIVSILLLSILSIGSFKTFQSVQLSANSNLIELRKSQLQQQLFILNKLNQSYSNISASIEFELLNCLIEFETECP